MTKPKLELDYEVNEQGISLCIGDEIVGVIFVSRNDGPKTRTERKKLASLIAAAFNGRAA